MSLQEEVSTQRAGGKVMRLVHDDDDVLPSSCFFRKTDAEYPEKGPFLLKLGMTNSDSRAQQFDVGERVCVSWQDESRPAPQSLC